MRKLTLVKRSFSLVFVDCNISIVREPAEILIFELSFSRLFVKHVCLQQQRQYIALGKIKEVAGMINK